MEAEKKEQKEMNCDNTASVIDEEVAAPEVDELVALVKAIKFAHSDYSVKQVHREIVSHQGKWSKVGVKRVKKHMQKLGLTNKDMEQSDGNVMQLMTIGGESKSSKSSSSMSASTPCDTNKNNDWLPVKLDVPVFSMQSSPYQGVIETPRREIGLANGELGEIFKIQSAASPGDPTLHPMLLYNKDRSRKTFVHPNLAVYIPVKKHIDNCGQVGTVGGSKSFFWGRFSKDDDMLYINVKEYPPFQEW